MRHARSGDRLAVKPRVSTAFNTPKFAPLNLKEFHEESGDKERFQTLGIAAAGERKRSAGGRGHTGKRLGLLAPAEKFGGDAEN